jgi:hypothetical protein
MHVIITGCNDCYFLTIVYHYMACSLDKVWKKLYTVEDGFWLGEKKGMLDYVHMGNWVICIYIYV